MDPGFFEEIGFSPNEGKVYLTLLEIGLATAGEVAKKSKVNRSNVYEVLERLVKKGLVAYTTRYETKYFEAASPNNLLRFIQEKEQLIKKHLPQLNLLSECREKRGEAVVREGVRALMSVLYGFLDYNDEIRVWGVPKKAVDDFIKFEIPHFHKERIKRKVVMNHIYNENATTRIKLLNKMPFTAAKFLPEKFNSNISTHACGKEVAMFFYSKPPLVIQIFNERLAESYKKYFDLMWEIAK